MNTKQIRQTILDLAIRGELVPQDPTDEPASVLLKRIRAEKEQLIKDKKLKRDKKDNEPIDEVPFELPEGWEWCRLGDLLINRDGERKPLSSSVRSKQIKKYDYYGATGVIDKVDNYIFDEKELLVGEDGANLLSKVKPNAFFSEGKYWVNNHAHILDATNKNLLDYVIIVINTISLDNYITGTAQPKLSQENLNKIPIPLPPLAVQHCIVEIAEQLLTIVDTIKLLQEQLKALVKQTKNQVLNYAIAGKLTHQDPNDEPAEELLKRIGKTTTTAADTPYEKLPKGWACTQLQVLCQLLDGEKKEAVSLPYLDVAFLRGRTENNYKESGRYIPKNTHLILVDGENSGEIFTTTTEGYQGSTLKILNISKEINEQYLFYVLTKEQQLFKESKTGSAIPHLNKKLFKELKVLLPPLAEQHRIVQQIETFFASFDQIEKMLT